MGPIQRDLRTGRKLDVLVIGSDCRAEHILLRDSTIVGLKGQYCQRGRKA